MYRWFSLLLLAACGSPALPTAPDPGPVALAIRISDYGVTGVGDETVKVNQALAAAALSGGTVDFQGKHVTAAMVIPATPNLIGQVRSVVLTNCMGSITAPAGQPVLRVEPGLSAYFIEVNHCLLLGSVDFSRMFNSRFVSVWILPPAGQWAMTASGAAYYNTIESSYLGGPLALRAMPTGGAATGPNTNRLLGTRVQGRLEIGPHVQNWIVDGNAFESCGAICLDLSGERLVIGAGNRFEGAVDGIVLRAGSDGWIAPQYWSSISGLRIKFDGADPLAWSIAPQPGLH